MNKYTDLDILTKKVNDVFNSYNDFTYSLDVIEHVIDNEGFVNKDIVNIEGRVKGKDKKEKGFNITMNTDYKFTTRLRRMIKQLYKKYLCFHSIEHYKGEYKDSKINEIEDEENEN